MIRITPTTRLWQLPGSTCFTVHSDDKEWTFEVSTHEELYRWLDALCLVFRRVLEKQYAQRGTKNIRVARQYKEVEKGPDDLSAGELSESDDDYMDSGHNSGDVSCGEQSSSASDDEVFESEDSGDDEASLAHES